MKKNYLRVLAICFATSMLFGITSCSKDSYQSFGSIENLPKDLSVKYVAPSGDTLFVSDEAFLLSTAKVLGSVHGEEASRCVISGITHIESAVGYSASIEYVTPEGEPANYIMTNIPFEYEGGTIEMDERPLRMRAKSTGKVTLKAMAIIPTQSNKIEVKTGKNVLVYSSKGNAAMKFDIK